MPFTHQELFCTKDTKTNNTQIRVLRSSQESKGARHMKKHCSNAGMIFLESWREGRRCLSGSLCVSMGSSKHKGRLASSYWVLPQVASWSQGIAPESRWPHLSLGCCVTPGYCSFLYVLNYSSVFDWVFADWKHLQCYRQSEDRGKSLRSWLFRWRDRLKHENPFMG